MLHVMEKGDLSQTYAHLQAQAQPPLLMLPGLQ